MQVWYSKSQKPDVTSFFFIQLVEILQTDLQDIVRLLQHSSFIRTQTDYAVGSGYIRVKNSVIQSAKRSCVYIIYVTDYVISYPCFKPTAKHPLSHFVCQLHWASPCTPGQKRRWAPHSQTSFDDTQRTDGTLWSKEVQVKSVEGTEIKSQMVCVQARVITSSSVISIPVTCPLDPTSLLKA